jgi:hypothetical protein
VVCDDDRPSRFGERQKKAAANPETAQINAAGFISGSGVKVMSRTAIF